MTLGLCCCNSVVSGLDLIIAHRSLPHSSSDTASISTSKSAHTRKYGIKFTYPLAPSTLSGKTITHPYAEITQADGSHSSQLEWQVHSRSGRGCFYELVDKTSISPKADVPSKDDVKAIYHHCGLDPFLPSTYTEGFLLLPEARDSQLDILIVSSLVALTRRIRNEVPETVKKQSALKRLAKVLR